jgi:tetratricopeptide (TPR) repeat protein
MQANRSHLSILLAASLLAAWAASCAHQPPRNADASGKRLAIAQDYYAKHLVAPALVEVERALKLDAESPDAYYLRGIIKMGQGVENLEMSQRSTCMQGRAAELEGSAATDRMLEARENFELALKFRPNFAEALDGLAVLSIYARDYDGAVRFEHQAQSNEVFAENPIAKGNLGWAYYGKKDFVRAEKELREAVARAPKFCVGRYRLGQVLLEEGQYAAAAEELGKLSDKECPIQEAYRALGLTEQHLRAVAAARRAFAVCERLAPRSCIADECRGYAKMLAGGRGDDE